MGPLVPDIIGDNLNFIVAFFIGIAFGFILEQAGFSTSKKLVGLFYGYDFTVLRVFFTAGIVAMFGVIALDYFGMLDMNIVYVNPTFLWGAIIGGFIMGLGFIIGGFCPGTSICAAAIGKIDAMVFILGSIVGVLFFAEGYPWFEDLYIAEDYGFLRAYEPLGISQSLFAFLLAVVAIGAFWATTFVETKVNGKLNPEFKSKPLYFGLTLISLVLAFTLFAMPDRKIELTEEINNDEIIKSYSVKMMDSDELAFRLMDNDPNLQIIDLRSKADFDSLSLPASVNMKIENLFDKDANKVLNYKDKISIFVADDEFTAKKAAVLALKLGYSDIYLLNGGLNKFRELILNFRNTDIASNDRKTRDTYRFRAKAANELPILIKENKLKKGSGEVKKSKRVIGGC